MTDNEVIEILAKREGWKALQLIVGNRIVPQYRHSSRSGRFASLPNYLHSKDALQLVLEKLSEEECSCLEDALDELGFSISALLTLPAIHLAHAIAEAIKEAE